MREWNEGHPEDKYTTWKGLKIAYDRLMARVGMDYAKAGD